MIISRSVISAFNSINLSSALFYFLEMLWPKYRLRRRYFKNYLANGLIAVQFLKNKAFYIEHDDDTLSAVKLVQSAALIGLLDPLKCSLINVKTFLNG